MVFGILAFVGHGDVVRGGTIDGMEDGGHLYGIMDLAKVCYSCSVLG